MQLQSCPHTWEEGPKARDPLSRQVSSRNGTFYCYVQLQSWTWPYGVYSSSIVQRSQHHSSHFADDLCQFFQLVKGGSQSFSQVCWSQAKFSDELYSLRPQIRVKYSILGYP